MKINKKHFIWGGVVLLVIIFIAIFSVVKWGGGEDKTNLSYYQLNLKYDSNQHLLSGQEKVEFINNYDNMFTHLYFHLYPNAFREGAKNGVVSNNNEGEAYPNGKSYGQIDILGVTFANGESASFNITGEDKNILEVCLKEELYPDEKVVLNIMFETTLANINHRLGYGQNTINLGNFYPIACVYESGKGFSQSLYHSNGDPFYSECANYEVNIQFDSSLEIASTGQQTSIQNDKDKTIATYRADKVRDFSIVLSEIFDIASTKYRDVNINYYGYSGDDNIAECLKTCVDAVETFESLFGKYPYSQLSVVKSNFVHGGMEYPNLVLISDTIASQNDINYVIVHEIAHQWWYAMVGNDEYNNAWLDEGLAEYSTFLFYKENIEYGESYDSMITATIESYKLFEKIYIKVNGSVDGSMQRALCDFQTEPEYVQCVYNKGVIMFNTLREMVGDKRFISTLRNYFEEFKYKNARPSDLIAQFVSTCGKSMEGFFESWLDGSVVIK